MENLDLVGSVTKRNSGTIRLATVRACADRTTTFFRIGEGGLSFQDYHRLEASALFFNNDAEDQQSSG